jgi:hypothetical protein
VVGDVGKQPDQVIINPIFAQLEAIRCSEAIGIREHPGYASMVASGPLR